VGQGLHLALHGGGAAVGAVALVVCRHVLRLLAQQLAAVSKTVQAQGGGVAIDKAFLGIQHGHGAVGVLKQHLVVGLALAQRGLLGRHGIGLAAGFFQQLGGLDVALQNF